MENALFPAKIIFDIEGNIKEMHFNSDHAVYGYIIASFVAQYNANRRYLNEYFWEMHYGKKEDNDVGI